LLRRAASATVISPANTDNTMRAFSITGAYAWAVNEPSVLVTGASQSMW
jgi:hypothetical protein